jgi:hypothetical protein
VKIRPGPLTRSQAAYLNAALEKLLGPEDGSAPLPDAAGGFFVGEGQDDPYDGDKFHARLTAGPDGDGFYSWTEVVPEGGGGAGQAPRTYATLPGGRSGSNGAGFHGAYERNGAAVFADSSTGTVVEMRLAYFDVSRDWVYAFAHCCPGAADDLPQKVVTAVCLIAPAFDAAVVLSTPTTLTEVFQSVLGGGFSIPAATGLVAMGLRWDGILLIQWPTVLGGSALVEGQIVLNTGAVVAYGKLQSTGAGANLILPMMFRGGDTLVPGDYTWDVMVKTDATGAGSVQALQGDTASGVGITYDPVIAEQSNYVHIPGGVAATSRCRAHPADCTCVGTDGSTGSGSGSGAASDCCTGLCGDPGTPGTLTATVTDKTGDFTALPDTLDFDCTDSGANTHEWFAADSSAVACKTAHGNQPCLELVNPVSGPTLTYPPEPGYTCSPFAAVYLVDDGAGNTCTVTVVS